MIINLNLENFKDIVMESDKPVLIKFYSNLCSACQTLDKVILGIEDEVKDKAILTQVDILEEKEITNVFKVKNTPTIVIMKEGRPIAFHVGLLTKKEILKLITQ